MSSPGYGTVETDDLMVDALAAGVLVDADDPVTAALSGWRAELVTATAAIGLGETTERPTPAPVASLRPRRTSEMRGVGRTRRTLAVAAATAAVVVGGGVAAAAVSGPDGPLGGLHRLVFGSTTQPHTATAPGAADRSEHVLDRAARLLRATPRPLGASERHAIVRLLDQAHRLIVSDPHIDASRAARLGARLHRLHAQLASLPASTTGTASSPSAVPGPGTGSAVPRHAPGAGRSDGPTTGPSGKARSAARTAAPSAGRSAARSAAGHTGHPQGPGTGRKPPTTAVPSSAIPGTPAVAHHGAAPHPRGHSHPHLKLPVPGLGHSHRNPHSRHGQEGHRGHFGDKAKPGRPVPPGRMHGHPTAFPGKKLRQQ